MHQTIYTSQDWENDKSFKAKPYQEITHEIYLHFLECLPPFYPPRDTIQVYLELDTGRKEKVIGAFQNSEASYHDYVQDELKAFYATFAKLQLIELDQEPIYIYM
jgi:hypothetical protein